jgi:hypothetical protein
LLLLQLSDIVLPWPAGTAAAAAAGRIAALLVFMQPSPAAAASLLPGVVMP